jgi:hypothetical protein
MTSSKSSSFTIYISIPKDHSGGDEVIKEDSGILYHQDPDNQLYTLHISRPAGARNCSVSRNL